MDTGTKYRCGVAGCKKPPMNFHAAFCEPHQDLFDLSAEYKRFKAGRTIEHARSMLADFARRAALEEL